MKKFIAVAGNIGVGKSTLVEMICERLECQPFYEPVTENPYLADFYADMRSWAFHSQVYFLCRKFRIHQELDRARSSRTVIQDRTIYEDAEIFARVLHDQGSMTDVDYRNYTALFHVLVGFLRKPDLIIYLKASPDVLMERIARRGRASEKSIGKDYIERLNFAYDDWMRRARAETEVLEIDTDHVPLQGEAEGFARLVNDLKARYPRQAVLDLGE